MSLWKFLRAGVLERGERKGNPHRDAPGRYCEPSLAANIYLDQLDKYMESHYLHLSQRQRSQRRQQGKANFLYVRYAD